MTRSCSLRNSLRVKVLAVLLAVSLIPLVVLTAVQLRSNRQAIRQNMEHSLQAAASETALRIDSFAEAKLTAIDTEAKLPVFSRFLLSGDNQSSMEALQSLRSLNKHDPIFIRSSGLINTAGRNVIDTDGAHVGMDESKQPYFISALETGRPMISSVRFEPESDVPYIALSAPVVTPEGEVVGVLRTFYAAQVLQQMIVGTSELAGPRSFAILLDENGLILAYGGASQQKAVRLLYQLAHPLSPETTRRLQEQFRLPKDLVTVDDPFAREAAKITDFGDGPVAALSTSLRNFQWKLAFVIPADAYFGPLRKQLFQTFAVLVLLALGVVLIALWNSRILFDPLSALTQMTRRVAAGDLDAKVPVTSRDELGELAEAFNRMTRELKERENEREELLASEKAARSEAEKANRLKDDFLATLSHELRTPLTAIIGWINLLKQNPTAAELEEGLQVIERNAWSETQLVDDLLDVSRIARGQVTLNQDALDVAMVVSEAIDTVAPAAKAQKITLETQLPEDGACTIGDWNRLRQVVLNLLNNALKFTPEGGRVAIRLALEGEKIVLAVCDNGIGIPSEHLERIFHRFMQVDGSSTRRYGGMGLGLSIARHLVELHGGSLRAESEGEGKGACFTVELPLVSIESLPLATPSKATVGRSASKALDGLRILLVEDDDDTLEMLRRLLEETGAEVITARNAPMAISAFETHRPDLLISDIGLPQEDGYSLLRRIRSVSGHGATVPAAALTAFVTPEDQERSRRAGFQAHLSKPVEPGRLAALIKELARGKRPG